MACQGAAIIVVMRIYVSNLRHCTCCLLLGYLVNVVEYNSAKKCNKKEMQMQMEDVYIYVYSGASSKQTGLLLDELSVTAKKTAITGYFYRCCCWYDNDDLVSGHGNKSLPRQRRNLKEGVAVIPDYNKYR